MYIYIYIYIYVCVCVCVYIYISFLTASSNAPTTIGIAVSFMFDNLFFSAKIQYTPKDPISKPTTLPLTRSL